MFRPTSLLLAFLLLLSFTWLFSSGILKKALTNHREVIVADKKASIAKLQRKAVDIKRYAAEKGFNDRICFMVDMSIPSGQERFFVYNLKKILFKIVDWLRMVDVIKTGLKDANREIRLGVAAPP